MPYHLGTKVVLTSVEPGLTQAWQRFCGDLPEVTIYAGSILDVACDAVVSPANSFGFLDGGIDALYRRHFDPSLQDDLQRAIVEHHHGERLVGAAEIIETGDESIPFLIAAPTMRVPMVLHESPNAYLAARAVLLLVQHGRFRQGRQAGRPVREVVETVAFPGLGTGVGKLGPVTCAHQVRSAIGDVLLGRFTMPRTWAEASERHQLLYTDRLRRLQEDT